MLINVSDKSWRSCFGMGLSATLCLLAPLVVFLTANNYDLIAPEVLILYLVAAAAGSIIFSIAALKQDVIAKVALWLCLLLAITLLYDRLSLVWLAVIAALSAAVTLRLQAQAATVLLVLASAHVGSTLVLHFISGSPAISLKAEPQRSAATITSSLPPVVHLVLDEFSGLHGLPAEIPEAKKLSTRLTNYFAEQGFVLSSHAYSQYFESSNSIPNIVNFTSSTKPGAHLKRAGGQFVLASNAYFDHLIDQGYSLNVLQSEYLKFCETPSVPVASCSTYNANSIEAIKNVNISATQKARFILNSLIDSAPTVRKIRHRYNNLRIRFDFPAPPWPTGNSRTGPLASLQAVTELESMLRNLEPGDAYFAHLLLPHYPYILNADCSTKPKVRDWLNRVPFEVTRETGEQNSRESRAIRYGAYLAQIECTQSMLEKLLAAVRASGQWTNSIIVIHGDHGSRIVREHPLASNVDNMTANDFRDAYSTFFAVRSGKSPAALDTRPRSIQTLLANVWGMGTMGITSGQVYLRSLDNRDLTAVQTSDFGVGPIDKK